MDIKQQITYVTDLLQNAALCNNWEAAIRFTFVLYLLQKDLIIELETNLKEAA